MANDRLTIRRLSRQEFSALLQAHTRWLQGRGGTRADLSFKDLSGEDLSGVLLSRAKMTGTILAEADLTGADLEAADLFCADLQGAILSGACLREADLRGVKAAGSDWTEVQAGRCDLRAGVLMVSDRAIGVQDYGSFRQRSGGGLGQPSGFGTSLRGGSSSADLCDARLVGANFTAADLTGVRLAGADLSRADFSHATLAEAVLTGALCRQTRLASANLEGARLEQVSLINADVARNGLHVQPDRAAEEQASRLAPVLRAHREWIETDGMGGARAVLDDLDLRGLDLRGVELSGASLRGADLSRADLSGARLRLADLGRALLYRAHLAGACLEGARLEGALLIQADLSQASLAPAPLWRRSGRRHDQACRLEGADLTGARVDLDALRQCRCEEAIITQVRRPTRAAIPAAAL